MDNFYVTLPSNASMDVYPDNAISHYTTRLRQPLDLDGRWEVALVEASVPTRWMNVTEEDSRIRIKLDTPIELDDEEARYRLFQCPIEGKHYERPQQLHRALNWAWQKLKSDIELTPYRISFKSKEVHQAFMYDTVENIITLNQKMLDILEVSSKLGLMLGIGNGTEKWIQVPSDKNTVSQTMSMNIAVNHIYLYTDIVDYVVTGDTVAPLLRILPMHSYIGNNQMNHHTHMFNKPHYIPVSRKHIESIHVDLRSDQGLHIPFVSGTSIVKLHFRRKR